MSDTDIEGVCDDICVCTGKLPTLRYVTGLVLWGNTSNMASSFFE